MRRVALMGFAFVLAVAAGVWAANRGDPEPPVLTSSIDAAPVEYEIERDPDVPTLPFDDNPDPDQCGIPLQWGDANSTAYLNGIWEGELIQTEVLLYDSHLRVSLAGGAPHGTQVQIVLFQENPVLDYYFVKVPGEPGNEGWVPKPFLSFEPVA